MIAPPGLGRAYEILDRMENPPTGTKEAMLATITAQAAHVQAIAAVHAAHAAQLQAVATVYVSVPDSMFTQPEWKQIVATIRNLMGFDLVAPTTTEEKSPWPAS